MSLSVIVWSLLRPSSFLVLSLTLGLFLTQCGARRFGQVLIAIATLGLVGATCLPVGEWAMATLEGRYARVRPFPDHVDGIIALGGAVIPSLTEHWNIPSLTDGAERMTAFVTLARHYPDARWVFAGGMGDPGPGHLREADVAFRLFADLGLDADRVLYERESQNTGENALFAQRLVQPRKGETWLLVTSAFHMPRAEAVFAKVGWPVTPWPVGFKSGRTGPFLSIGLPSINLPQQLTLLDYAFHEWIGIVIYRLTGRL